CVSLHESGRFWRVIAEGMYLAATVFAPFGTGTFLGGTLLSTTAPGGVFGVASWAVLPKNTIRAATPPATRTSAATDGSTFVMRWLVVGGPGFVAANSPTSGIVDANFGPGLARLGQVLAHLTQGEPDRRARSARVQLRPFWAPADSELKCRRGKATPRADSSTPP